MNKKYKIVKLLDRNLTKKNKKKILDMYRRDTINEIKKNKATQDNQLQFSAKTSFSSPVTSNCAHSSIPATCILQVPGFKPVTTNFVERLAKVSIFGISWPMIFKVLYPVGCSFQ